VDQSVVSEFELAISVDDAVSAWFEGDFEHCLSLCDRLDAQGRGSRQTGLLRARALLRLDRAPEALELLEALHPEDRSTDGEFTRRLLLGAALTRVDDPVRALEILQQTKAEMQCAHPAVQSEVALNIGLAWYALRELDAADAALDEVLPISDIIHARSLEYKGWIASARGDYGVAPAHFIAALERLEECTHYDRFLEANCLQALGHLATDGLDRTAWQPVCSRRETMKWGAGGLDKPRFSLALSAASFENDVEGRPLEAAIEARRACDLAPTPAYRAQALCKRASIAHSAGERIAHADHLQAAVDAFKSTEIEALSGNEMLVPLVMAGELANGGRAAQARWYFDRYRDPCSTPQTLVITGDYRRATYELLVAAQIAEAEGRCADAVAQYRDVARRSVHGALRDAVIASIRIAALTGGAGILPQYVAATAHDVKPSSWMYATLKDIDKTKTISGLTALQREYLEMVSKGYTNPHIAKMRGRSIHTVRNHVADLFSSFGVKTRTELAKEYLRVVRSN